MTSTDQKMSLSLVQQATLQRQNRLNQKRGIRQDKIKENKKPVKNVSRVNIKNKSTDRTTRSSAMKKDKLENIKITIFNNRQKKPEEEEKNNAITPPSASVTQNYSARSAPQPSSALKTINSTLQQAAERQRQQFPFNDRFSGRAYMDQVQPPSNVATKTEKPQGIFQKNQIRKL
ncbi:hypothetical protein O9G_001791 [Rozella allomycis CSF55]|uniref:Uncharacterized protein n=1 Tax=Rozella allomycis (strain CSF55) TaxID=988480 RepID=A0A075AWA7_ROZAC|nr:hypothetical protein O9G_001791 [Rozella allomycis CSF55]|eukprot:EPZ34535.1 hypothetical protein O9G_001791 [Rozella allomycis CSF55]